MCNVVVVVSTVREDGRDGKQQQRLQPEHVVLVRALIVSIVAFTASVVYSLLRKRSYFAMVKKAK